MADNNSPVPIPGSGSIHLPYEDAIIAGFTLIGKVIDGMTPEQKVIVWQNWIDFWQPILTLIKPKNPLA